MVIFTSQIKKNIVIVQKSSAEKTKIAAIFYVYATLICKTQFHWSLQMKWPGINQSATIFLPPCVLAYDVMSFCVDANITTGCAPSTD